MALIYELLDYLQMRPGLEHPMMNVMDKMRKLKIYRDANDIYNIIDWLAAHGFVTLTPSFHNQKTVKITFKGRWYHHTGYGK